MKAVVILVCPRIPTERARPDGDALPAGGVVLGGRAVIPVPVVRKPLDAAFPPSNAPSAAQGGPPPASGTTRRAEVRARPLAPRLSRHPAGADAPRILEPLRLPAIR